MRSEYTVTVKRQGNTVKTLKVSAVNASEAADWAEAQVGQETYIHSGGRAGDELIVSGFRGYTFEVKVS